MPYYKGVHFEQAYHSEEDLLAHNAASVAGTPAPVAPPPPASEPELAVSVPDRETPLVEIPVTVESDPFPAFAPEKDPETQPEPVSEKAVDEVLTENTTAPDTPDAKKKKSGRRG